MYVLVVRDPEGNETEYDLVGEAVLGRDESADIQMPDPGVSRRHARVFLEDGLCYVEDLGSANGTLIDKEAVVGQVVLEPGRAVALGPFELWVEDSDAEAAAPVVAEDVPSTMAGPALGANAGFDDTQGAIAVPKSRGRQMLGTFEGISGAALGQIFEVRDGATVGRLPGVDIIVDDPSISRRHAEIRFLDGEIVVRDLDSGNGTFVNESPIAEQALYDDDLVTFGSVAFRFSLMAGMEVALGGGGGAALVPGVPRRGGRRGAGKAGGGGKRKKLLLAVGGVFLVFMVVLVMAGRGKTPPSAATGPSPKAATSSAAEDLRSEVFNLMRRGQMLLDSESWGEAEDRFARVVELDPINADARQKLEQARLESRMEPLFNDGNRLAQFGNLEDALKVYMQIDKESTYRRRARFQTEQLIERLMSRYDGECRGFVRANRFQEALPSCRRYMDFGCQCPANIAKSVEEALETAERRARVPAAERWRCPSEGLEEWVRCASGIASAGDPSSQAIHQQYANEQVAGAVVYYFRGQLDEAIREMGRAEDLLSGDAAAREQARNLRNQMRFVQAKFRQLQTELRRGAIDGAQAEMDEIIAIDPLILPSPLQSSTRQEALRMLSGAYHDRGFELQSMRRFPEAFDWYRKGYAVNPDDTRIGEAIRRLESTAMTNVRRAQTCGELRQILRYTMEDPPSAAHQQVKEAIARRGC